MKKNNNSNRNVISNTITKIVYSQKFEVLINFLIIFSVLTFIINRMILFKIQYYAYFEIIDYIIVIIFTFEFLVKFINNKFDYFIEKYGWIDFLSILPILSPAIKSLRSIRLLRLTRIIRFLRILKITKSSVNSPLKQKFFIAISSFVLIIFLLLGFIIYENRVDEINKYTIDKFKLILLNTATEDAIKNLFDNEKNIQFIKKIEGSDNLNKKNTNILSVAPNEKLMFIRNIGGLKFHETFFKSALENKIVKEVLTEIIKTKNKDFEFTELINKPYRISNYENIISNFNYNISQKYKNVLIFVLNKNIRDYQTIIQDTILHIDSVDKLNKDKLIVSNTEYVILIINNKYKIIYNMFNINRQLRKIELNIILISLLNIIILLIGLNLYFERTFLNKILSISNGIKKSLQIFYKKEKDNTIFNKFKDNNKFDELDILNEAYNFLIKNIEDSFEKLNFNNSILESFNTIYTYLQKTYDINKYFNYFLIALTNKKFLRYDRAVIFLYNKAEKKYYPKYSIGSLNRKNLISQFNSKNEFYSFNPGLKEAFELYTNHAYFENKFKNNISKLVISEDLFTPETNDQFKDKGIITFPLSIKTENQLFKIMEDTFKCEEYCLTKLNVLNRNFGFIYFDNNISAEQINENRINQTKFFITEFIRLFENYLLPKFLKNGIQETELQKNEKTVTKKILKELSYDIYE